MTFIHRLFGGGQKPEAPAPAKATEPTPKRGPRPDSARQLAGAPKLPPNPFALPEFPPGVAPKKGQAGSGLAMDDAFGTGSALSWGASEYVGDGNYGAGSFGEVQGFFGFQRLALLAQRAEYRKVSEIIATESTRKWIKIQASGDDEDKTDKIKQIEAEFDRLKLRDVFRKADEQDGLFGRAHLYIDLGDIDAAEKATPIGNGSDNTSKAKVGVGKLRAVRNVEASWCYPLGYNTADPMAADWYRPQQWLVMGTQVHSSRLLTIVGRPVPDILKPAYAFGGVSLSQMMEPYVSNWLRTWQSVSDIVNAYSVFVLKTEMQTILQGGMAGDLIARLDMFNSTRTNRGVLAIDMNTEDFQNISANLGTLDHLQAQSQEHMASIASIPLVKLLGIAPSGLNATSEGEIRVFYDSIHAGQEQKFRQPLTTILGFVQLSLFGEVDPEIGFVFEPLWSMSEKELAEVREIEARTGQILVDTGVISQHEERTRVAADEDTPYQGLDLDEMPDLVEAEAEGLVIKGGGKGQGEAPEGAGESDAGAVE